MVDRKTDWGEGVFAFLDELLEGDLHSKGVLSLANATLGVMASAPLAVAVIGQSLAQARGLLSKHAIKQVDRLLSNRAIERRPAADWVGKSGHAVKLFGAMVTAAEHVIGAVVGVQAKHMKEPWCLATSLATATARQIIDAYARRWTVEPSFRDMKDIRFGIGLSLLRISRPNRRDRLLLLNAFAMHLLTMLGTAGEELGMDRHLKSNTSKTRRRSRKVSNWATCQAERFGRAVRSFNRSQ